MMNTIDWLKKLVTDCKISMSNKSKMLNEINQFEVMPKRLRKWQMQIN